MDEWQPISTAPRDGNPILAAEDGYAPYVVEWFDGGQAWIGADHGYVYPTHWMHLPAPPQSKGEVR